MAVRVETPVTREMWQEMIGKVYPECAFLDFATAFAGSDRPSIAPRLEEILAEFPRQAPEGSFAWHEATIIGFWLDPHHNYIAIRFSKTTGDEFDGFMVNSLG